MSVAVVPELEVDVTGEGFAAAVASLVAGVAALGARVDLVDLVAAGSARVVLGLLAGLREEVARVEVAVVAHFERLRAFSLDGARSTGSWLEAHTRRGSWAAAQVARAAEACRVPLVRQAVEAGGLSVEQAAAVQPLCVRVSQGTCDEAELLGVLEASRGGSVAETKLAVARVSTRLDARDGKDAVSQRSLRPFATEHGTKVWRLELEPDAHATFGTAIDALVNEVWRSGDAVDAVEMGRRRADAAVQLAERFLRGGTTPSGEVINAKSVPQVIVHLDYDTLRGELDAAGLAFLDDGTPISGATARRIACEAGLLPVVLNGAREVLDLGRAQRFASAAQRIALQAKWCHCAMPDCPMPIGWTKAHHVRPWGRDGPTDLALLVPFCERHHHLFHEGGWTIHPNGDGYDIHRPDGTLYGHTRPDRRLT